MSKHEIRLTLVIDGQEYGMTEDVPELGLALGDKAKLFALAAQLGEVTQRTIIQHFL